MVMGRLGCAETMCSSWDLSHNSCCDFTWGVGAGMQYAGCLHGQTHTLEYFLYLVTFCILSHISS